MGLLRTVRRLLAGLSVCVLLTGCSGPAEDRVAGTTAAAPVAAAERLAIGDVVPGGTFNNLNPAGPAQIDLQHDLGVRPVIFYYWVAGNARSEEVFRDLENLTGELGADRIALYGVAVPRPNLATVPQIRNRTQMLGLRSAILEDADFTLGTQLGAARVPHISLVDREGRVRLTNGASMAQPVTTETDLASLIRSAARTGQVADHGELPRYHPVKELEGLPAPNFRAPLVENRVERSLTGMLDDQKLNVLVFWSVDCGHCRKELPQINAWLRQHPGDVNIVSCARAVDSATMTRTAQFAESNGFLFPTLVDGGSEIMALYRINSTPTFLIIRPDGVIHAAIVSHSHEAGGFGDMIESQKRELFEGA